MKETIYRTKLYKSGKIWVAAGLMVVTAATIGGVSQVNADTVNETEGTTSATTNENKLEDTVSNESSSINKDNTTTADSKEATSDSTTTDQKNNTTTGAIDQSKVVENNDNSQEEVDNSQKQSESSSTTTDTNNQKDTVQNNTDQTTTDSNNNQDDKTTTATNNEKVVDNTNKKQTTDSNSNQTNNEKETTTKDSTTNENQTTNTTVNDSDTKSELSADKNVNRSTDKDTVATNTDKNNTTVATDATKDSTNQTQDSTTTDQDTKQVTAINSDAKIVTGSYQNKDDNFTFIDQDGNQVKGFVQIDNNLQYFDENGNQVKGQFVTVNGHNYYLNASTGNATTNVSVIDGKTVGFDNEGKEVYNDFATDSQGVTYYFNEKGDVQTGLQTINNKTYYFDQDGHQKKGFSGVFKNQVLYFDDKTGESVSTTISQITDGLTVQNTDATPHNAANDTSLSSFTTVDGYLTAQSWYRPKDIQVSETQWRASTDKDFRPIMMTWWGTKEIQVNYLNYMADQGLINADKKFSTTDSQTLLNQAAQSVQLEIEKKIVQENSTEWLRTEMDTFIATQDDYNKNSETPNTDHLQAGALTYINSPLTPDSNSNFRLMNRTPTQQDGKQNYTTDNSQGGFELLLANDVDNSNPVVQAEQLNWIYYLTHFGTITSGDADANFDGIRIDAVDNVDADLLNIAADYFKAAYGVDKNDATANQHISILEDWSHNDPQYVKDNGSNQLTMDDYIHTQLIWSLTKNTDIRGTMERFKDYYLVDRSNDSTENTATANYSFVRAHDSEVQTVIAEIINKLYPNSGSGLIPTQEEMDAAFKIYNADMNSADKQYTQYNMPSAYAMLLTNKDTVPRVYYGDLYTDDGQYMETKSPYYDAINTLLQARIKYVAGGQSLDVDKNDVLTSVRYGKGASTKEDKGTDETRTEGIGIIVSNNEQLNLNQDTVVLHMGAAHANQDYRALLLTTDNGLEKYSTDTGAPVKRTNADGDLIFTADEIKGYKNVEVSGFLSAWVPTGADDEQDARTASSTTENTDKATFHSNAALDSQVIYEGFSNFQSTPTKDSEFTNVKIAENGDLFKSWGVTSFQLAPQYRSSTDKTFLDSIIQNGYAFTDRYDLGFDTATKYGTATDLTAAIKALHASGIQAIADFVPDQIYNLPGQEITTVNRTDSFGNPEKDSDMQNVLYATNSKGGGKYQELYGGEFLSQLQKDYPTLFTTKQVSTGVPIDASTQIKEWSAKYFNGSDIQGKGQEYVLRDNGTKEYFKITSNSNDSSFLPKQLENQESVTGFTTDEYGTTYYSTSGYQAKNSFIKDDNGNYYYFDKDGYMVTGLQNINTSTYYFLPNGVELRDSFVQNHSGKTQYFAKSGKLVTNKYITDQNGNSYYFDENGNMVTDQIKVIDGNAQYFSKGGTQIKDQFVKGADGNTRYFNAGNGNMATNRFAKDADGNWYYLNDKGFTVTGWQTINNKTYYFDANGKELKNSFIPVDSGTSYVNGKDGSLVTNDFIYSKGSWYYADQNGLLTSGVQTINGKTYYFDNISHTMLKSSTIDIDGNTYYFNENGEEKKNGLQLNSDQTWSYYDQDGKQVKDEFVTVDNNLVYFNQNGKQVKGNIADIKGNTYYFDKDSGNIVKNKLVQVGDVYKYFDENGQAVKDTDITIDNVSYHFNNESNMVVNDYYQTKDGNWYYADQNGTKTIGFKTINNEVQYFDQDGKQVKNGFVTDTKNHKAYFFNGTEGKLVQNDYFTENQKDWYYADNNGDFVTGFQVIRGYMQYFDQDGKQVKGAMIKNQDTGKTYYFDNDKGNGVEV